MRKNKIAGMVTALVLAAVMLTGCGSTAGNSNASQSAQAVTSAATQTTESSAAATTESAIAETAATQETQQKPLQRHKLVILPQNPVRPL